MNGNFSWERFHEVPIVGILRRFSADAVREMVLAAQRGGLTTLEITIDSADAPALIRLACELVGDSMNIGAGTVCTLDDLARARQAGAEFIVTPIVSPEVIRACRESGLPVFPGAYTPTEVYTAWSLGASMVKVFPADQLGPAYIRNLQGPLAQIPLLPTGGVTVETLPDYLRAGAKGFGVGSPLFPQDRAQAGDWAWIEERARLFVETYRSAL